MKEYNILEEVTKNLINDACKQYICINDIKIHPINEQGKVTVSFYQPCKPLNNSKLKKKCLYIPKKNEKKCIKFYLF